MAFKIYEQNFEWRGGYWYTCHFNGQFRDTPIKDVCFEVLYRQYPLWHHFNSGYIKYITKVLTYLSIFSDHDISTVSIFNTQYKCSHTVTSTRSGEIIYGLINSEKKSLKKMIQIVCLKHFRIVCMGGVNLVCDVWLCNVYSWSSYVMMVFLKLLRSYFIFLLITHIWEIKFYKSNSIKRTDV